MKFSIFALILAFAVSCHSNAAAPFGESYIIPACALGASLQQSKIWPGSKYFLDLSNGRKVCTQPIAAGLKVSYPLRIIPYRGGLADVELECDNKEAREFFNQNRGGEIFFISGGKGVVNARIPDQPESDRCALLGQPSLESAIAICEAFAQSTGQDKNQCWEPCSSNAPNWACVVNK